MFILRKITGSGVQSNICLNKVYNLIREEDKEEFEKTTSLNDYYQSEKAKIYAFLIYDEGSQIIPLFKAQKNYIMSSDGNTFDNLTYRG
ncbi:MAG: hypothetical protein EOO85_17060 [Pedobacter sp.]|nr:MAG: hypothetical protein EOO85_17060 [Pedobacter sp.]